MSDQPSASQPINDDAGKPLPRMWHNPAVLFSLVLLVVIGVVFFIAMVGWHPPEDAMAATEPVSLLMNTVEPLLASADAGRGATLIETHQCVACHNAETVAPLFVGLGSRAAAAVPDLPAAGYVYQSIVSPGAHVVEGYQNIMIGNYSEILPQQDIADIVAYLLTQ